jgi:hypothetical protein
MRSSGQALRFAVTIRIMGRKRIAGLDMCFLSSEIKLGGNIDEKFMLSLSYTL